MAGLSGGENHIGSLIHQKRILPRRGAARVACLHCKSEAPGHGGRAGNHARCAQLKARWQAAAYDAPSDGRVAGGGKRRAVARVDVRERQGGGCDRERVLYQKRKPPRRGAHCIACLHREGKASSHRWRARNHACRAQLKARWQAAVCDAPSNRRAAAGRKRRAVACVDGHIGQVCGRDDRQVAEMRGQVVITTGL